MTPAPTTEITPLLSDYSRVIKYTWEHPGSTSRDVADALKLTTTKVAQVFYSEMKKPNPVFTRKVASQHPQTGADIFAYSPAKGMKMPELKEPTHHQLPRQSKQAKAAEEQMSIPDDQLSESSFVIRWALTHPNPEGLRSRDVSAGTGVSSTRCAQILLDALSRYTGKQALFRRKAAGKTPSGKTTYLWFVLPNAKLPPLTLKASPRGSKQAQAAAEEAAAVVAPATETETGTTEVTDAPLTDVMPRAAGVEPMDLDSLDGLVEHLAEVIANRAAKRISFHLAKVLAEMIPREAPAAPLKINELAEEMQAGIKVHKPSVLVAGLLPQQAGLVQSEFGEVFDLRFFETEQNLKKLGPMLDHVDHVFTFTSKISHAVEDVMKHKGKKINRCTGGMTMLRDQLRQLHAPVSH